LITHVPDGPAAQIDERKESRAALALHRRVVDAGVVGGIPLGIAPVELEAVLGGNSFA